jgi:hypothetical protein
MKETLKAYSLLLSVFVIALFIGVLYKLYLKFEAFENNVINKVNSVEKLIIDNSIMELLESESQSNLKDDELIKMGEEAEKNLQKLGAMVTGKQAETMEFHEDLGNKIEEAFTNSAEIKGSEAKSIIASSIENMEKMIEKIQNSMYHIKPQASPKIFTLESTNAKGKKLILVLQEYAPGGSPTGMYLIPQSKNGNSTLQCLRLMRVLTNNIVTSWELGLDTCLLGNEDLNLQQKKTFLFEMKQEEDKTTGKTFATIFPIVDADSCLFLKVIDELNYTLEVKDCDYEKKLSEGINVSYTNRFVLKN